MTERFKVADCKSVGFPIVGSNPTFFLTKYNAVGSVPVLGTGSHVFKSHYFEFISVFAYFSFKVNDFSVLFKQPWSNLTLFL